MITLTEAKYVDGYRIWIKFSDNRSGVVDFTDLIQKFPAASPLVDYKEFQHFYLDDWPTLAWPCGFDFSPESLYELATGQRVAWLHDEVTETTHS
jgi:hypothetical protein